MEGRVTLTEFCRNTLGRHVSLYNVSVLSPEGCPKGFFQMGVKVPMSLKVISMRSEIDSEDYEDLRGITNLPIKEIEMNATLYRVVGSLLLDNCVLLSSKKVMGYSNLIN